MAELPQIRIVVEGNSRWVILRQDGRVEEWVKATNAGNMEDGCPQRRYPLGMRQDTELVAGSFSHSVALSKQGILTTWRANPQYQPTPKVPWTPRLYVDQPPQGTISIATQEWGSLFLTDLGTVFFQRVQAGQSSVELTLGPFQACLSLPKISRISAGEEVLTALDVKGGLWTLNRVEQHEPEESLAFHPYVDPPFFVEIAEGTDSILGLTSSGAVFATGSNDDGQLGLGDYLERYNFVKLPGLPKIARISMSPNAVSMALDIKGGLWVWGFKASATPEIYTCDPQIIPLLFSTATGQVPPPWQLQNVMRNFAKESLTL